MNELRKWRLAVKKSQAQIAKEIGANGQQIYHFEKGVAPVPAKYVVKYAKALKKPERVMRTFFFTNEVAALRVKWGVR